jgi:hypothetical protein
VSGRGYSVSSGRQDNFIYHSYKLQLILFIKAVFCVVPMTGRIIPVHKFNRKEKVNVKKK